MDALHDTLSGPATKQLIERVYLTFNDTCFERLASISVSHLYNLRSKLMGIYHIIAVDCVTSFQLVVTCKRMSGTYLLPIIQQLLGQFPFTILGFHADNGSEYINYKVAKLLEKLRIEFTKSRPRHSNIPMITPWWNPKMVPLCASHRVYTHILQRFVRKTNAFCADFLNSYVNFHHPCFFPEAIADTKDKEQKKDCYEHMMAHFEKLKSLPDATLYLKPGITFEQPDTVASRMSDN